MNKFRVDNLTRCDGHGHLEAAVTINGEPRIVVLSQTELDAEPMPEAERAAIVQGMRAAIGKANAHANWNATRAALLGKEFEV